MPFTVASLAAFLRDASGRPITVRINTNRSTLLSVRPGVDKQVTVSIHRVFLSADEQTINAIVGYLRVGGPTPAERHAVQDFISRVDDYLREMSAFTPPKKVRIGSAKGKVYHLRECAQIVNELYFAGLLTFRIGWGKGERTGKSVRRHITLGTASVADRIVRIHPILDREDVPVWFLDFVIFHELLHLQLPPYKKEGGGNTIHSPEFKAAEKRHPHYKNATAWEKKWIWKLVRVWEVGGRLPSGVLSDFAPPYPPEPYFVPKIAAPSPPPRKKPAPKTQQLDLFGDIL